VKIRAFELLHKLESQLFSYKILRDERKMRWLKVIAIKHILTLFPIVCFSLPFFDFLSLNIIFMTRDRYNEL
jgi:hypothetical protein